jgi:uncharacterized iron-regulated membrane protein
LGECRSIQQQAFVCREFPHGPAGTCFVIANHAIHTGDIFGYPTKILMSFSSLILVIQAMTGYYMLWKRQRRGQSEVESEQSSQSAVVNQS